MLENNLLFLGEVKCLKDFDTFCVDVEKSGRIRMTKMLQLCSGCAFFQRGLRGAGTPKNSLPGRTGEGGTGGGWARECEPHGSKLARPGRRQAGGRQETGQQMCPRREALFLAWVPLKEHREQVSFFPPR